MTSFQKATNKQRKTPKAIAPNLPEAPKMTSSPASSNTTRLTTPATAYLPQSRIPRKRPNTLASIKRPCHRLRIITNVAAIVLIHVASHHITAEQSRRYNVTMFRLPQTCQLAMPVPIGLAIKRHTIAPCSMGHCVGFAWARLNASAKQIQCTKIAS
jgi:hypothetical protein